MNSLHSSISIHLKGQHLCFENRVTIQVLRSQGQSLRQIARTINCSAATVKNELKRGQKSLYHDQHLRYDPKIAQQNYQNNRLNCGRKCEYLAKSWFIAFVEYFFFNKGWSLDACVGEALATGKFTHDEIVCTKILYHYVALVLLRIKVSDLPELLTRNTKSKQVRINKRKLGRSIDERLRDILKQLEFGIGSVI